MRGPALLPAAAFTGIGVLTAALGGLPLTTALGLLGFGLAAAGVALWHPRWTPHVLWLAVPALAVLAVTAPRSGRPLVVAAALATAVGVAGGVLEASRRAAEAEGAHRRLEPALAAAQEETAALAAQLDRRINELFSLQELSYILAESLHLEQIAAQVARYVARFLQAEGALVALGGDQGRPMRVAAAEGTLASLKDSRIVDDDTTLVTQAVGRERIELAHATEEAPLRLLGNVTARSAAVAPLRAHGVTLGAVAVVDRPEGPFTTEHLWLLSTVATSAAVVLANSRFFEMFRQGKEEWETTFDALAEGIAVVDPRGRISRANRALAELLKRPPPALIGEPFGTLLFGDPQAAGDLLETTRTGAPPPPLTLRSAAIARTLRLTASPLPDRGAGIPVVVLVEDVTEQRAVETQYIQNEKMAAIGQLVSGVAHELNNPLTSIAGLSEFLLEQGRLEDLSAEHLRVIHDQAERAGRIVRNLLTFARKGAPETAPADLADVVARTSLLIAYELKLRDIELERRVGPGPVMVLGDRYELQQVLLNLLTNAAHALGDLPEGTPRRIVVETVTEGNQVLLRVADNGPGVPPDMVGQLFTPFFTTKGPGHGTGLGLSISYGIVESHGGRLSYAPGTEGGAVFTVRLPALSQQARTAPQASSPAGRRILLVDADQAAHRVISALLAPDGHQLDTARSGLRGLDLARQSPYDLIIASADARSDTEPFVPALLREFPDYRRRLILTDEDAGRISGERATEGLPRFSKPFNLRHLHAAVAELLHPTTP